MGEKGPQGERGYVGDRGPEGSVPKGSVCFWDEEHPVPEGWKWMDLPSVGQYRLLFAKFLLTERCYRPIVKQ